MDLSKAFDTINLKLLIAKLHAYGFSKYFLGIILSYVSNRYHRVKVNTTCSSWAELIQAPQGSVFGPILFNIYLNDLFFLMNDIDIYNFADDTTAYVCDVNSEPVLEKSKENSELAVTWFEKNFMKLNTDKCHLIVSGTKYEHVWANLGNDKILESNNIKLLGIKRDKLKFDGLISDVCLRAYGKLSALTKLSRFFSLEKLHFFKAFLES